MKFILSGIINNFNSVTPKKAQLIRNIMLLIIGACCGQKINGQMLSDTLNNCVIAGSSLIALIAQLQRKYQK